MGEKVGILGGTFDPVHDGHIAMAEAAICEQGLAKVLFIPAATPPHKLDKRITSFAHRVEMLRLALQGHKRIELCLVEESLPKPSYTIDTIKHLQKNTAPGVVYSFIIGLDSFLDIQSWKSYRELLARVSLLVAVRQPVANQRQLDNIATLLNYQKSGRIWYGRDGLQDIHFLQEVPPDLSSSEIRMELRKGKDCSGKVDHRVLAYIRENTLYC